MVRALPMVLAASLLAPPLAGQHAAAADDRLTLRDVFELEVAAQPAIAPDGTRIVFTRRGFDIMTDRVRTTLWTIGADGSNLRPLRGPGRDGGTAVFSPTGDRLLFVATVDGKAQLWVRWMDSGQEAVLTHLAEPPAGPAWSPDGQWIAFTMFVPAGPEPFVQLPAMPEGADWGPPIKFIDRIDYREDGAGYLRSGYRHVFVVSADGGTPRQLTDGPFDDGVPQWAPDGSVLLFSANRHPEPDYDPRNTEIYEVSVATAVVKPLTSRHGPDGEPAVSPDGRLIAYTGFDDRRQGYQVTRLYLMNRDGSRSRLVSRSFDRDVGGLQWSRDGTGLFFQYDDRGDAKVGFITLAGDVTELASGLGGLELSVPYSSGVYAVAPTGRFVFTQTTPDHPADLAVGARDEPVRRITRLNDDLFAGKKLGSVEELWWRSSFDQRRIQGWIVKPPDFDPAKKYPMILEIHGGPFLNYGVRFSSEVQLYAAAGYVVLYANPRGSTGYGEEFGNLLHHDYPDQDYDDLMAGVDAVVGKGYVDPNQLFVTGGSYGGLLTAWTVGHTNRFKAAVVAKPVINWYSFVLTADGPGFYYRYRDWTGGEPWDNLSHYMERSPISYVGNVTTPTMLMTGEVDYLTPSEEAEQFFEALKIRRVPTAMVRIPDASHAITRKPSNLVAKVAYTLGWFEKYRGGDPHAR